MQEPDVTPAAALPLTHSWPLFERDQRLELGRTMDIDGPGAGLAAIVAGAGQGHWDCDLADNSLTWSAEVYALFGLPRRVRLVRDEILPLYTEGSRALMERLRAYAIRHRRGFTLDAELQPADGGRRWMRLIAAPVIEDGRVVRLQGLKLDVSHQFGDPAGARRLAVP